MVRADIQRFSNNIFRTVLSKQNNRIEESARLIYTQEKKSQN